MEIALLSDTHGFFDPAWHEWIEPCQEIWHAGDVGSLQVLQQLQALRPLRGVWGNIDGPELRQELDEHARFEVAGVRIWITHIGPRKGKALLVGERPDVFICGHSHIPQAVRDPAGVWRLNPGACGRQGFHLQRTAMRLTLRDGQLEKLRLLELGPR